MLTPGRKGAIAETAFAAHATRLGFDVYRPVAEGGRYDLILDVGSRLPAPARAVQVGPAHRRRHQRQPAHVPPDQEQAMSGRSTPPRRSTRSGCTAQHLTVATFCR